MSANFRILADDLIRAATLAASPALDLGVNYLKTQERAEVARTADTTNQVITGDFAASSAVDCAVLWRHNLTTAATWRVELFSAISLGGTKVYDSTAVDALPVEPLAALGVGYDPLGGAGIGEFQELARHSVLYFGQVTARSFRLTLSDASNPDGYMQASRLMMGACWEPSQGADYGAELQWIDDSPQVRSAAGTSRTPVIYAPYRQIALTCSELARADADALLRIVARVGKRAEFWISLYPGWGADDAQYADAEYLHGIVGKLAGPHSATHRQFNLWADRLQVQEI